MPITWSIAVFRKKANLGIFTMEGQHLKAIQGKLAIYNEKKLLNRGRNLIRDLKELKDAITDYLARHPNSSGTTKEKFDAVSELSKQVEDELKTYKFFSLSSIPLSNAERLADATVSAIYQHKIKKNKVEGEKLGPGMTYREFGEKLKKDRGKFDAYLKQIAGKENFIKALNNEISWNRESVARWLIRMITPEIESKNKWTERSSLLQSLSLSAAAENREFAEQLYLEMSIYCECMADRVDVKFIVGQAFTLLGSVLAPLKATLSAPVGYLASTGQAGVQLGAGRGVPILRAATPESGVKIQNPEGEKNKLLDFFKAMIALFEYLGTVDISNNPIEEVELIKELGEGNDTIVKQRFIYKIFEEIVE